MKFRVREGFQIFRNREDLELFQAGGLLSHGIAPLASGGEEVTLNLAQCASLCGWDKGKLEPLCAEAKLLWKNVRPTLAPPPVPTKTLDELRASSGTILNRDGERI